MSMAGFSVTYGDGTLHLAMPHGEMRLQWQPEPQAEQRMHHNRWEPFIPEFRILTTDAPDPAATGNDAEFLRAKQQAFVAFRATLPKDIAAAVERFRSHQWALLVLAHDSKSGSDLLRCNPVLAYALANNAFLQKRPMAAAAFQAIRYSHRKQRDILGWLGFPASEAMTRLFRKLPHAIVHPGLLRKLRQAVALPSVVERFSHLPALGTGVIYLACYAEMTALVTPTLIREVAVSEEDQDAAPTADALQEIVTLTREMGTLATIRSFASCRKVWETHERILVEHRRFKEQQSARDEEAFRLAIEARRQADRDARAQAAVLHRQKVAAMQPFPPPPVPGTDMIIPLTSFAELKKESLLQRNCVGKSTSYAARVLQGTHYIYRVLAPTHHTLCIGRRGHGIWVIEELKGYANAAALASTRQLVQVWLRAHQVSL